jgi:dTDP-4-dehydrorhamnose 3,5-epimerase-like enzyme
MYKILNFPKVTDNRGSLTYINNLTQIPFEIKRVFIVSGVPQGLSRGGHAHKILQEVLIPISGNFCVEVSDGTNCAEIHLSEDDAGILIPPSSWRVVTKYSPGAICLSLCSEKFDNSDYLHTWQEFKDYYGK